LRAGVNTVRLRPLPGAALVEDSIPKDHDALNVGVVEAVGLGTVFVADEDHRAATIFKLLQSWASVLDMPNAPEHLEVVYGWRLAVPCFKWRLAVERARRRSIQDVNGGGDDFSPKISRQILGLEHEPSHGFDALVPALNHPVLLQGVGGSELSVNVAFYTISAKLNRCESPPRLVRSIFSLRLVSTSTPAWKFLIVDAAWFLLGRSINHMKRL
jgi:hypothetical protein